MSEADLRKRVGEELRIRVGQDSEDAKDFIIEIPPPPEEDGESGTGHVYLAKLKGINYFIKHYAEPYFSDPKAFAEEIPEGRLQRAVGTHRAWLSVEVIGSIEGRERATAYRTEARLMAALAGPDCLAICCPELESINVFDERFMKPLRSEDPLALLDEPTFAPVLGVDGADERMIEAVAEAKRRWPEFVAAFKENDDPEAPFIVKAEFRDGDAAEFMWVSVTRIDEDTIHGTLENTPNELTNVHAGQPVTVPLPDLNDWMYVDNEEPVGGFTLKVIQEMYGG